MSYIMFIAGNKQIHKFLKSVTKPEIKRMHFMIATDDIDLDDIPKKAACSQLKTLMPPPNIFVGYVNSENEEEFQMSYYRYLSRPFCHAAFNKIAKTCFIDNYDTIVVFGDIDKEARIPKYVRKAFSARFPVIKSFEFKDWKDDPNKVMHFRHSNESDIVDMILTDAADIGRKLKELDACKNNADSYYE